MTWKRWTFFAVALAGRMNRQQQEVTAYVIRVDDYSFRLSYAQCRSACLWTGLHEKSPLTQFLLI